MRGSDLIAALESGKRIQSLWRDDKLILQREPGTEGPLRGLNDADSNRPIADFEWQVLLTSDVLWAPDSWTILD